MANKTHMENQFSKENREETGLKKKKFLLNDQRKFFMKLSLPQHYQQKRSNYREFEITLNIRNITEFNCIFPETIFIRLRGKLN